MLRAGDRIELHIDRLSSGGRGVGRHEGQVVFVGGTAPEELTLVEVTLAKKRFAEAKLLKILQPSPFRVQPPCPIAGACGGCSWQHVAYEEQLRQKRQLVADALKKFAGFGELSVNAVKPSPNPFHYRNRIQLHYDRGRLGFFRRSSHEVVDVDTCWIAEPALNVELRRIRAELTNLNLSSPSRLELFLTPEGKTASDLGYLSGNGAAGVLGFSQVNFAQNQNLVDYVTALIHPDTKVLLDLYAGAGNFTFPAADRYPSISIDAVEFHPVSAQAGQAHALALGEAHRIEFINATVETFLDSVLARPGPPPNSMAPRQDPTLNPARFRFATVILDPPRAGCSVDLMKKLVRLEPLRLIYVSCDPVTLARDLSALARRPSNAGNCNLEPGRFDYEIIEVQPFDMFPQTDHVETVVLLQRKKES